MTSPTSLADSVRSLSGQLKAVAQALSTPDGGDGAEPELICALHELATLGCLLADDLTAPGGSALSALRRWLDVADLALALATPGRAL
jgi:hypothetical protein